MLVVLQTSHQSSFLKILHLTISINTPQLLLWCWWDAPCGGKKGSVIYYQWFLLYDAYWYPLSFCSFNHTKSAIWCALNKNLTATRVHQHHIGSLHQIIINNQEACLCTSVCYSTKCNESRSSHTFYLVIQVKCLPWSIGHSMCQVTEKVWKKCKLQFMSFKFNSEPCLGIAESLSWLHMPTLSPKSMV